MSVIAADKCPGLQLLVELNIYTSARTSDAQARPPMNRFSRQNYLVSTFYKRHHVKKAKGNAVQIQYSSW